jgi:hypothetical protein
MAFYSNSINVSQFDLLFEIATIMKVDKLFNALLID